jgi:hypothetical protein
MAAAKRKLLESAILALGEDDATEEVVESGPESKMAKLPSRVVTRGAGVLQLPANAIVHPISKKLGMKGLRITISLFDQQFVSTHTSAGKYLPFLVPGSTTYYPINRVANTSRWSDLSAMFSEFFVSEVKMRYVPINKFSAISGSAGVLVDLNTTAMNVGAVQHLLGPISDSSAAMTDIANFKHMLVNSGDKFSFNWKNCEKFSFDGPIGDMTTSGTTQGWCLTVSPTKFGGCIVAALPSVTAASATVTAFAENANLGYVLYEHIVHFRSRD